MRTRALAEAKKAQVVLETRAALLAKLSRRRSRPPESSPPPRPPGRRAGRAPVRARLARWNAAVARRRPPPASSAALPSAPPRAEVEADETQALTLLARRIYETATAAPWQDADFQDRARSFVIARAVLREMAAMTGWTPPSPSSRARRRRWHGAPR